MKTCSQQTVFVQSAVVEEVNERQNSLTKCKNQTIRCCWILRFGLLRMSRNKFVKQSNLIDELQFSLVALFNQNDQRKTTPFASQIRFKNNHVIRRPILEITHKRQWCTTVQMLVCHFPRQRLRSFRWLESNATTTMRNLSNR